MKMQSVSEYVEAFICYGRDKYLIRKEDTCYTRNRVLEFLGWADYTFPERLEGGAKPAIGSILDALSEYGVQSGLCENYPAARERFEIALMGLLTPVPSIISDRFWSEYAESPRTATDYFYSFCLDCSYIRVSDQDLKWKTATKYGKMDITINLAKPEKDPRDIAKAGMSPKEGYPACMLCVENEGYAGRAGYPARNNLRLIPVSVCGEDWAFQYSPYSYYNEHCIILNRKHAPMVIDDGVFNKLLSFVGQFPHYFVGSNADLPIVGGSILSHEHFQGGRYTFAMEKASGEDIVRIKGFDDVKAVTVKWPMPVIRLSCTDKWRLAASANKILSLWREYTDPKAGIFAFTGNEPHNTVTPIARVRNGKYELDIVLRNNITSHEHPMGVFHPHSEVHHIKKENIGLIEVMGLAVLPSRLKNELNELTSALLEGRDIESIDSIAKHASWVSSWRKSYAAVTNDTIGDILRYEVGKRFEMVLEHAGVFKRTQEGRENFRRFLVTL